MEIEGFWEHVLTGMPEIQREREREKQETEENCTMKIYITCTFTGTIRLTKSEGLRCVYVGGWGCATHEQH